MPSQNRALETTKPASLPPPLEEAKADDSAQGSENHCQERAGKDSDSDGSSYPSDGEKDEFILVKLTEVRKEVQCPICLGIIRKTRTVMECLHRFCRECIDKSMRLGNNECPACRTHCASRRSLRDDPNYDSLIAVFYPDIDKYEEEELAFNEEEKARNRQIQDLIANTFRQQEELGKKKTSGRTPTTPYSRRQNSYRASRGHITHRFVEQASDEEEEANDHDGSKDSSSDERSIEIKSKRQKRWGEAARVSHHSIADEDYGSEVIRDLLGPSATLVGGTEILAWGKGGLRSKTRHGGPHGPNGKFSRNNRILRLVDRLRCPSENDMMLNISITLVSLNKENIPSLKRPYLSCNHTSSVKHLCQYVAMQTSVDASEIEMLIVKNFNPVNNSSLLTKDFGVLNPSRNELLLLSEHQTLGEIQASFIQQNLVLAYRQREPDKETEN